MGRSDDDLFAVFGSSDDEDDDLFASSSSSAPARSSGGAAASSAPDWLSDFDGPTPRPANDDDWLTSSGFGESEAPKKRGGGIFGGADEEEKEATQRGPSILETGGPFAILASEGEIMGMSPMQRMVISIFVFVNTLIFACGILLALGVIAPF